MLCKSLYTRPDWTEQRFCIPGGSFIKIDNSLLPIRLSRYASMISICLTKSPSSVHMARKILKDLRLIVGAKALLKSMLGI